MQRAFLCTRRIVATELSHLSRKYDSRTLSGWFDFRGLHTSPILAFPRQVSKLRSHRKIEDKSGDSDKSAQTEKSTKQDQNHEEQVTGHTLGRMNTKFLLVVLLRRGVGMLFRGLLLFGRIQGLLNSCK